jgi:hypothetical protein
MRESFRDYRPQAATREVIERANRIIAEYLDQGFTLTARQLFYQFVARGWLPNTEKKYKNLYRVVGDARDGGLIDWNAIEDRTREVQFHSSYDSPAALLNTVARRYRSDWWEGQEYRPEVWIEKDALLGVIEGVCTEYRVPYFATRGNCSQTLVYETGKRLSDYLSDGLIPLVLHLADHDPTGIDMTRDLEKRLALYADDEDIEVRRIALNLDQVRQYNPAAKSRQGEGQPLPKICPAVRPPLLGARCARAAGDCRSDPARTEQADRRGRLAAGAEGRASRAVRAGGRGG